MFESQFANDFREEEADYISGRRDLIAGPKFFRRGASAEHVPPFENTHRLAGFRQIGSRDKAVVTAADYDTVILLRLGHPSCIRTCCVAVIDMPSRHRLRVCRWRL